MSQATARDADEAEDADGLTTASHLRTDRGREPTAKTGAAMAAVDDGAARNGAITRPNPGISRHAHLPALNAAV